MGIDECSKALTSVLSNRSVLLTSSADGRVNTIIIGWGILGIVWNIPIATVYVKTGRHARSLIDANSEFTINIPSSGTDRRILGYRGSHSGKDVDKVSECGRTLVEPRKVSVPVIAQFPLTLECRVVSRGKVPIGGLPDGIVHHAEVVDVYTLG